MVLSPEKLCGLKVAVIGAAREGTALARYLAYQGAQVTLSDTKPAEVLEEQLANLDGLDLRLALGGNPPDLLDVDLLFLSPGVPPTAPIVREARRRGLPISSEPRLFTQLCTAPIVGITGSSGKTTTTALVGKMYAADGRNAWVGGNIGVPLIGELLEDDRTVPCSDPDVAVMELSSFQLELFSPAYQGATVEENRSRASRVVSIEGWSPHIAAITNITPNHLDRHPSMADYIRAKSTILAFQQPQDWAVLNLDNSITRDMGPRVAGRLLQFSLKGPVSEGAFLRGNRLVLRLDGRERILCCTDDIKLRGRHNVANILTAACCAMAGSVSLETMHHVATTFPGVPHRLEVVREWRGILFVNDSIATSPERSIAALRSFTQPVVLLAGGRDKHLPWDKWADLVLERVHTVVVFGEAVPIVTQALREARKRDHPVGNDENGGSCMAVHHVDSLERAVSMASELARTGDVVLLSPGGTSFDAFRDFEARGQVFRDLVAAL